MNHGRPIKGGHITGHDACRDRALLTQAQDATEDPEPIMLAEGAHVDPVLQALLRSEVGLEAPTPQQLARWATGPACLSRVLAGPAAAQLRRPMLSAAGGLRLGRECRSAVCPWC